MVAEIRLKTPWSPSFDPFKFQNLGSIVCVTFKSFQAPIAVSIVRSRHSESNGCGTTSGNALEPEL